MSSTKADGDTLVSAKLKFLESRQQTKNLYETENAVVGDAKTKRAYSECPECHGKTVQILNNF